MSFDRVFLGAAAVTAENGICEADHAQARLKELMARRGNAVYVLADSSKFGPAALPRLGPSRFRSSETPGLRWKWLMSASLSAFVVRNVFRIRARGSE